MNGLPGIILAVVVALVAFKGYVSKREELAVARAEWKQERDRLRNAMVTEQLAAEARNRVANDSIARLNAGRDSAVNLAAVAGRRAATASEALHAIVDSNAAARAALDTLEAAHAQEKRSLQQALAFAQAETQVERDRVADRDAQLLRLRGDLATAITRADRFERQANPGWLKRVVDSPETHLAVAAIGFAMGSR